MKLTSKHTDTSPRSIRVGSYIVGFGLSLALTLGAYLLVSQHVNGQHLFLTHRFLISVVLVLAMIQLIVQLVFFLHLGREEKPRWNLRVLLFAVLVVTILVVGSLWIMAHLNYNMQLNKPSETDSSIIKDEGFKH